jgi:hypothetical protein
MDESAVREIRWRDYALHVQNFQFHLDLVLKGNIIYFGIIGGILSFILTRDRRDYALAALLLPVFASLFLGLLFFYASRVAKLSEARIAEIARSLDLVGARDFLAVAIHALGLFAPAIPLRSRDFNSAGDLVVHGTALRSRATKKRNAS